VWSSGLTLDLTVIINNLNLSGKQAKFAVCTFDSSVVTDGTVSGAVTIHQRDVFHPAVFNINITGLSPGKHGFHVHQNGDLGNNCIDAGGHYNPYNKTHGPPYLFDRHVGALGNILADSEGRAVTWKMDKLAILIGENNIMGRAIVIHQGEDDLGLGGNEGSLKTGNAGPRAGCCLITET